MLCDSQQAREQAKEGAEVQGRRCRTLRCYFIVLLSHAPTHHHMSPPHNCTRTRARTGARTRALAALLLQVQLNYIARFGVALQYALPYLKTGTVRLYTHTTIHPLLLLRDLRPPPPLPLPCLPGSRSRTSAKLGGRRGAFVAPTGLPGLWTTGNHNTVTTCHNKLRKVVGVMTHVNAPWLSGLHSPSWTARQEYSTGQEVQSQVQVQVQVQV